MPDTAPRWRRALAGAPILRGHWAALLFIFLSGVCADKVEVVDRLTSGLLHRDGLVWWPTDWPWALFAIGFGVLGKLALDMYGRVCWLSNAPEGTTWRGLSRDDVNPVPWIRRPRWLMWNH